MSDEKKDENDPSFDGLKDVDSFASSEATLTEEYLEMYAQNSGVCAHARSSSSSKESTEEEEDDTKSHQSTPSKKFIVNTSTGATGKSLARKKKKEQRAMNRKEKRIKREADDAEFEKLICRSGEPKLCYFQGPSTPACTAGQEHTS